jgi:hypothetical protein
LLKSTEPTSKYQTKTKKMAAISLNFALRTTSSVKTVHLIGSWDGYQGQLPLSKDREGKKGSWKGTFRFQPKQLKAGGRYWYYYQMDGYSVSHDPSQEFTVEPTTGRKLNILNVPAGKSSSKSSSSSKRDSRRLSREIPKGRPATEIKSPKPYRPGQTQHIVQQEYSQATLDLLAAQLAASTLEEEDEESEFEEDDSDVDSDCSFGSIPSLTSSSSTSSRSSNCSSPSSVSSDCSCKTYGITRDGSRVKIDCGGDVCGLSSEGDCSEDEKDYARYHATRRHGVVIR